MLIYHLTSMEVEMQPLSESLNRTWAQAYTRIENSDFDQILRKVHTRTHYNIIVEKIDFLYFSNLQFNRMDFNAHSTNGLFLV